MRRTLHRLRQDESGAVIIELLLAMWLMIGVIVFLMIFNRMFTERSRMLSANRTVAWMFAHTDPKEADWLRGLLAPKDGTPASFEQLVNSGRLSDLVAEWHFRRTGLSAGIVIVTHEKGDMQRKGNLQSGIFVDGNDVSSIKKMGGEQVADRTGDSFAGDDGVEFGDLESSELNYRDKVGSVSNANDGSEGNAMAELFSGFGNFLTSDFRHYHASVSYGMPLVFPRKALEFFFGPMDVEEVQDFGGTASSTAREGQLYAFIRPDLRPESPEDTRGGCVMPVLDCGSGGGYLNGLSNSISDTMEAAEELEDRMDKYRPAVFPADQEGKDTVFFETAAQNATTQGGLERDELVRAMRALLVFEEDYPDPPGKTADKDQPYRLGGKNGRYGL